MQEISGSTQMPQTSSPEKVPGMAFQALAGEIIEALLADEKDGEFDLTAGLFGKNFSVLVRRWATAEWLALQQDKAIAEAPALQEMKQEPVSPSIASCIIGSNAVGGAIDGKQAATVFKAMLKAEQKWMQPNEDVLWHEIHRLRAAVQGPTGYKSWQEAATAERLRRVEAERQLAQKVSDAWCPDVCPFTGLKFFMWIAHHETGRMVPTYGGPFDSYTIPVRDKDGSYYRERYDHDYGGWLTHEVEDLGIKIVSDQAHVCVENPKG